MQRNRIPEDSRCDNMDDQYCEQQPYQVKQKEGRPSNGMWKRVPWKRFIKKAPWGLVITLLRLLWLLIIWTIHHFGW